MYLHKISTCDIKECSSLSQVRLNTRNIVIPLGIQFLDLTAIQNLSKHGPTFPHLSNRPNSFQISSLKRDRIMRTWPRNYQNDITSIQSTAPFNGKSLETGMSI